MARSTGTRTRRTTTRSGGGGSSTQAMRTIDKALKLTQQSSTMLTEARRQVQQMSKSMTGTGSRTGTRTSTTRAKRRATGTTGTAQRATAGNKPGGTPRRRRMARRAPQSTTAQAM